ncbi:MAG: Maf family protein [Muribaculaceae bacterium]|nr:Maf family protein [Muribaculaceae bacterium]
MEYISLAKHFLKGHGVILGSASPRRRELLKLLVPEFAVLTSAEVDETFPADMPHPEIPEYLSKIKAAAFKENVMDGDILITADTMVLVDDKIMGKPADVDEAVRMLKALSGRNHTVITGVTVMMDGHTESFSESTTVYFRDLTDEEINLYVENCQPYDKAGAYGIQEWIGAVGITHIDGCFYNVMGLPLHRLYECVKKMADNLPGHSEDFQG